MYFRNMSYHKKLYILLSDSVTKNLFYYNRQVVLAGFNDICIFCPVYEHFLKPRSSKWAWQTYASWAIKERNRMNG